MPLERLPGWVRCMVWGGVGYVRVDVCLYDSYNETAPLVRLSVWLAACLCHGLNRLACFALNRRGRRRER